MNLYPYLAEAAISGGQERKTSKFLSQPRTSLSPLAICAAA
jgi:hypothetical protein